MGKRILVLCLAVILTICLLALPASAGSVPDGASPLDVGNFNDYGGGGWDSGGSDWGGSSDWSSDYGSDYDSDYSSGSSGLGLLGLLGCGGGSSFPVIIIVVVVVVVMNLIKKSKGNTSTSTGYQGGGSAIPQDNTSVISAAITGVDPNFNSEKFVSHAKEVFITLQNAWMARDWETVRTLESDALFQLHNKQLQEYITLGRINVIERISVTQAFLHKYEREEEYEHLTVFLSARMTDYIKDEKTGAVLKGNPNQDSYGKYLMKFTRSFGKTTSAASTSAETVACPHCGAPTRITSSGKCEFCGFIISTGTHDWVLSGLDGVKAGTNVDNRGVIIRTNKMPGGDAQGGGNTTGNGNGGVRYTRDDNDQNK